MVVMQKIQDKYESFLLYFTDYLKWLALLSLAIPDCSKICLNPIFLRLLGANHFCARFWQVGFDAPAVTQLGETDGTCCHIRFGIASKRRRQQYTCRGLQGRRG